MAPSQASAHSEGTPSHNSDDESDYHEHELRASTTRNSKASSTNARKKPATSRRASQQTTTTASASIDDSSLHHEDSADPQNARKMQNRLAQREFRARRLEHIKELEARVEFLSKPQSEQTEILVAIIHGLMDENKQLRGSLKTMANFVSTGLGGFSNAIQLPKYDDALELVNRGDRALLLKLVQEKGASVGATTAAATGGASCPAPAKGSDSPSAATFESASGGASNKPSAHAHADKKRKSFETVPQSEPSAGDRPTRPSAAKAPRTRSQNQRTSSNTTTTRQENINHTTSEWQQQVTPRETPPAAAAAAAAPAAQGAPSSSVNVTAPTFEPTYSTFENAGQYLGRPQNGLASVSNQSPASRATDIFPSYLSTGGTLNSFDVFGGGSGNGSNTTASEQATPSTFAGLVKQEDSPPLPTFGDSASAWMNAYTNLTPVGGNESFWSLTSSAMNNQAASQAIQQAQQQQQQNNNTQNVASDPQDGRSPSSSAYLSTWNNTANQMLSANGNVSAAFASMPHSVVQQPLHGYA